MLSNQVANRHQSGLDRCSSTPLTGDLQYQRVSFGVRTALNGIGAPASFLCQILSAGFTIILSQLRHTGGKHFNTAA